MLKQTFRLASYRWIIYFASAIASVSAQGAGLDSEPRSPAGRCENIFISGSVLTVRPVKTLLWRDKLLTIHSQSWIKEVLPGTRVPLIMRAFAPSTEPQNVHLDFPYEKMQAALGQNFRIQNATIDSYGNLVLVMKDNHIIKANPATGRVYMIKRLVTPDSHLLGNISPIAIENVGRDLVILFAEYVAATHSPQGSPAGQRRIFWGKVPESIGMGQLRELREIKLKDESPLSELSQISMSVDTRTKEITVSVGNQLYSVGR